MKWGNLSVWVLAFGGILVVFLSQVPDAVSEEATLRCSTCPAVCTSAHSYQLSCHNACRSVNPRLTQVRCENNRCICSEPLTTTTAASTTTKKKKKFFG